MTGNDPATLALDFALQLGRFELAPRFTSASRRLALYGASGSGKSLTLEVVAGLVRPASGVVRVGGETFFDAARRLNLSPQARRVGYVPQQYLLFPHLSAAENVRYGLRDASNTRVHDLLELVGLLEHAHKRPHQLSGGQQQRVALARALASEPKVLLLDEPFAALDDIVRTSLRRYLAELLARLGTPTVLVTHDLVEATMLADEIAVYRSGRVVQLGPGDDLFLRPAERPRRRPDRHDEPPCSGRSRGVAGDSCRSGGSSIFWTHPTPRHLRMRRSRSAFGPSTCCWHVATHSKTHAATLRP